MDFNGIDRTFDDYGNVVYDDVDPEEGSIADCDVETYYRPPQQVCRDDDRRILCVLMDDGGVDLETRIPYELLESMGITVGPFPVGEPVGGEGR